MCVELCSARSGSPASGDTSLRGRGAASADEDVEVDEWTPELQARVLRAMVYSFDNSPPETEHLLVDVATGAVTPTTFEPQALNAASAPSTGPDMTLLLALGLAFLGGLIPSDAPELHNPILYASTARRSPYPGVRRSRRQTCVRRSYLAWSLTKRMRCRLVAVPLEARQESAGRAHN